MDVLFLVTTSLCQDWVLCALAAFLGNASRFSGALSKIEPWFSLTPYCRGRPIPYHRELIEQKVERLVANSDPHSPLDHQRSNRIRMVLEFNIHNLYESGLYACVSSRITSGIHAAYAISENCYCFS